MIITVPAIEACSGMQPEQSTLLDTIEELRTLKIGSNLEFPQFVLCGSQSAGKTTVVNAISRVRLPTDKTRFAMEIIMRKNVFPQTKVTIEPGPSRTDSAELLKLQSFPPLASSNDLASLVDKAKEFMGIAEGKDAGFKDDVLKIEISGPDQPELTLVDLPGLSDSTSEGPSSEGDAIVRKVVEKYLKDERSIIMAVISAKMDFESKDALNIAASFDPSHKRTMGIITHLDALESGSESEELFIELLKNSPLRNQRTYLPLGWVALHNQSSEPGHIPDDAQDEREEKFFEGGRWADVPRWYVGIGSLRNCMRNALLNRITRHIPSMKVDVEESIAETKAKLKKLGPPRTTIQEQRSYLLGISSRFERIVGQALNGMYIDDFFHDVGVDENTPDLRRLRAVIRDLSEDFAEAMEFRGSRRIIQETGAQQLAAEDQERISKKPYFVGWKPEYVTRASLEAEVRRQTHASRYIGYSEQPNHLLVGNLFRDQAKPWKEIARCHLMTVWDATKHFVYLLLRNLANEFNYPSLCCSVLDPSLNQMKDALLSKLEELTAFTKRGYHLSLGQSYLSRIQISKSDRRFENLVAKLDSDALAAISSIEDLKKAISKLESSGKASFAAEIIDQHQAYYDSVLVIFVNNITTLAIENCLQGQLESIFTSLTVNNMDDEQIQTLALESDGMLLERQHLVARLKKLRAGLSTLNADNSFQPLWTDQSTPVSVGLIRTEGSVLAQYMNRPREQASAVDQKSRESSADSGASTAPSVGDVPSSNSAAGLSTAPASGAVNAPAFGFPNLTGPFSSKACNTGGTFGSHTTGSIFGGPANPPAKPRSTPATEPPKATGLFASWDRNTTAPPFGQSQPTGAEAPHNPFGPPVRRS